MWWLHAVVACRVQQTDGYPPLNCFSFYSAYFGLHFPAEHIPGVKNTVADLGRNYLAAGETVDTSSPAD